MPAKKRSLVQSDDNVRKMPARVAKSIKSSHTGEASAEKATKPVQRKKRTGAKVENTRTDVGLSASAASEVILSEFEDKHKSSSDIVESRARLIRPAKRPGATSCGLTRASRISRRD